MRVGIPVYCDTCKRRKAPHGRSAPLEIAHTLCDFDCEGYSKVPLPGCLWPGETSEEFGFESCQHATEEVT